MSYSFLPIINKNLEHLYDIFQDQKTLQLPSYFAMYYATGV